MMTTQERKLLDRLVAEAQAMKRQMAQIPSRWANTPPSYQTIVITGGNTLVTGEPGIKRSSTAITSVPSAYDPNVDTAFIDGIGRGVLRVNGSIQSGYVLVVVDTAFPLVLDLIGIVPATGYTGDVVVSASARTLTVSSGGTVSAYVPVIL